MPNHEQQPLRVLSVQLQSHIEEAKDLHVQATQPTRSSRVEGGNVLLLYKRRHGSVRRRRYCGSNPAVNECTEQPRILTRFHGQ